MAAPKKYPDELRARALRWYRESEPKPVIRRLAEQLGIHHEALRNWIRQDDRGSNYTSFRFAQRLADKVAVVPESLQPSLAPARAWATA